MEGAGVSVGRICKVTDLHLNFIDRAGRLYWDTATEPNQRSSRSPSPQLHTPLITSSLLSSTLFLRFTSPWASTCLSSVSISLSPCLPVSALTLCLPLHLLSFLMSQHLFFLPCLSNPVFVSDLVSLSSSPSLPLFSRSSSVLVLPSALPSSFLSLVFPSVLWL